MYGISTKIQNKTKSEYSLAPTWNIFSTNEAVFLMAMWTTNDQLPSISGFMVQLVKASGLGSPTQLSLMFHVFLRDY